MLSAPAMPYRRVVEACTILSEQFGTETDLATLERSGCWQDAALVVLAEAVAGLALETRVGKGRLRRL